MRHKNQIKNYYIGFLLLKFIAGYVNVMTILLFAQMLAGHTESLTNAAMLFADGDFDAMFRLLWISFSFFSGSVISGIFIRQIAFNLVYTMEVS